MLLRSNTASDRTRLDYSAFGTEIGSDGSSLSSSVSDFATGFQGYNTDGDDLINMGGREYDARAHRFLTPDRELPNPFSSQSYNPYSFAQNDPINNQDPSGFDCVGAECGPPVSVCLGSASIHRPEADTVVSPPRLFGRSGSSVRRWTRSSSWDDNPDHSWGSILANRDRGPHRRHKGCRCKLGYWCAHRVNPSTKAGAADPRLGNDRK